MNLNFLNRPLACFGSAHLTTLLLLHHHHPAVYLRNILNTRGSSEKRLPPRPSQPRGTQRHPTRSHVRLLLLQRARQKLGLSFSLFATQPWRGPVDGVGRARAAPLHMLARKPETAFHGLRESASARLACSAWDGCRTAGEGSGAAYRMRLEEGRPSNLQAYHM